ncbi:MAG: AAA family ATPase [Bacteroidales bacterium]|nr:AAA family ATPase [Bacteroidales bacterium]
MLQDFFRDSLRANMIFEPTGDQSAAMDGLSRFVSGDGGDGIFVLSGYAGTGKTTLVGAFVKTLASFNIRTVLMAPTGRAAKVLSSYSGMPAYTIHRTIYRQQSGYGAAFSIAPNLMSDTFFIVDEASMISQTPGEMSAFGSGRLLDDLVQYVFSGTNCRLVLVGDAGQLPPVGSPLSPALDTAELGCYGCGVGASALGEVVRQAEGSGILSNATMLRRLVEKSLPGQQVVPQLVTTGFNDIERISGATLLEALESSYDSVGVSETLVVTRSNKYANIYNNGIRSRIFWREESLTVGDIVMVVKNNYFYAKDIEKLDFIANGDTAEVVRIGRHEELYGFHFINVDLRFTDYDNLELSVKIIQESLQSEGPSLTQKEADTLYKNVCEDYAGMTKSQIYKELRNNEYFNALQIKFAYAVTCHKSQGGQWANVFIDNGYLTDDMLDREYLRWLYTAITRATQKVYLVNFNDKLIKSIK